MSPIYLGSILGATNAKMSSTGTLATRFRV